MSDKLALAEIIRIATEALAAEGEEDETETEENDDGMQAEAPEADEAGQVKNTALRIKALRDGRPHRGTPMQGMHRGEMVDAD